MDFFTLIILIAVLSALGSLAWWIVIIWVGVKVAKGVSGQMEAHFAELNRLIQQAQAAHGRGRPFVGNEFQMRWNAAQSELNALDDLRRQQSELRMADIKAQAASYGLFP